MSNEKRVLDPCCGSRMMWFNKDHPEVVFGDIRTEEHVLCDGRTLSIQPDIEMDFTCMPFPDESFWLVAFDPPHLRSLGESSWMFKKYGVLGAEWQQVIRDGFNECMRVLKPNGTLIFKWNEVQISTREVLNAIDSEPLFGHTSGRHSKTTWMTFIK